MNDHICSSDYQRTAVTADGRATVSSTPKRGKYKKVEYNDIISNKLVV